MALISLQDVSIGFGGPRLLDEINLQIESGEWVGLLGRNGMGKSTLLKLIAGDILPHEWNDSSRQQNIKWRIFPRRSRKDLSGRVKDIVESGLEAISGTLDDEHLWQRQHQVEKILSRMELDPEAKFEVLSAGLKRRVYLARGLVRNPDLLLLDEPTNHLDITPLTGWKISSSAGAARYCLSRMTVSFCKGLLPASWSWTAANCSIGIVIIQPL